MSDLQGARNRVRDRYGAAVAQKASDAFLLFHGRSVSSLPVPALTAPRAATVLVLETRALVQPSASVSLATRARARLATADLLREAGETHPELSATATLRRYTLARSRDVFLEDARYIVDELERSSGESLPSATPEMTAHHAVQPRFVDLCWLNGTVRTVADARTVASVAEDRSVRRIDLPQILQPEIGATAGLVGAPAFRSTHGVDGRGVIVAVIDTEIHDGHPGLAGRVARKHNFIALRERWRDPSRGDRPRAPHGTAVAGIIGASAALSGMAPAITFYNYKVLATDGVHATDFDGAKAIQRAVEDGAHIANCSWGPQPGAQLALDGQSDLARACNAAWSLGLVVVKSAGNNGTLTTPSDADGVIAVGATNRSGTSVPSYSGRGRTAHGLQRPHLVAPGGIKNSDLVTSCTVFGVFTAAFWGTSFAAAHVSGLVALLLSRDPDLTPDEVRSQLLGMCTPIPGVAPEAQGSGLPKII